MKQAILISIAMLLIFGCATKGQAYANITEANTSEELTGAMPVDEMQNANTSGLSFGRNASGVLNTDVVFTERQKYEFSNATTQDGRLIVYYFYSSACPASKALRPEIDRLEGMYDTVEWLEYDIVPQGGMWAYQDFAAQYNLSREQRLVPQVLVNGTIITDRFNINKSLEEVLASFKVS